MIDPERALRFVAPSDLELRGRLYRALAQELVVSSRPAAVLFESSTDRPIPEVTVSPHELLGPHLASPAFRPLRTLRAGVRRLPGPDRGLGTSTWTFEPIDAARSPVAPRDVPDVPEGPALLGVDGRVDFQTFWLSGRTDGRLWAARRVRFLARADELADRAGSVARFAAAEWSRASGVLCRARVVRRPERAWAEGSSSTIPANGWLAVAPSAAERSAEPTTPEGPSRLSVEDGHTIVLGASGAGKTTFLVEQAVRAIRQGFAVLAVDLHGDLASAIVARMGPEERRATVAIDASRRPVAGIAALAGSGDRAAAQFVAAVKRLTPDGTDVYWGFRLERIFDAFVRLVQEFGGSLGDLYALLTDADRRDAARLATRSPELARFLEELGPIVRRSPEFLWAAAARLAKVVLVPELAELLSPADGGVPVEELLERRRPLLVRIPFSAVGPEAASFAGTLVLARAYLGVAGAREPGGPRAPIVVVLDEVQGLSPRLVAEMLTEGRKFGLRLIVASQYPERLAPELRLAAAGVSRQVVAFRVPRANAAVVGGWLGLPPGDAERSLSDLPVGVGVTRASGVGDLRTVSAGERLSVLGDQGWTDATARTLTEFPSTSPSDPGTADAVTERLLLAVLAADERGAPARGPSLVDEALGIPGPVIDRAVAEDRLLTLVRDGLAHEVDGAWHLAPAGERWLGLRSVTGASRESDEHRALLLRAFRLFARHGHRIEIVRQGRYDTTLPDAVFRQIPERARSGPPRQLAEAIASAQRGWAWRAFDGRDVHLEAEVSGALRPVRIRHGLAKARARGAFALFLVGDAARASRVRRTLRAEGVGPSGAQVWTLRAGGRLGGTPVAHDGKGSSGCSGA